MSLTINNYLSSIQDTRATGTEKLGQKDKAAEVGKMRESSISASLDQVNMGEDGVAASRGQKGPRRKSTLPYPIRTG